MKLVYYTNAEEKIPAPPGAVSLVVRIGTSNPIIVPVNSDGFAVFSTGGSPGTGFFQFVAAGGGVLDTGSIELKLDLAHAAGSTPYDPRSQAEITLDALEAKIAGRALTIQQSKVTVGDRSIEYMNSIEELLRWRDYFRRVVAKERGQSDLTAQVCVMRRA